MAELSPSAADIRRNRTAIEANTRQIQRDFQALAVDTSHEVRAIGHEATHRAADMSPRQRALDMEGEQTYDRIYDPKTYQDNLANGAYAQIDRLWRRHAAEYGLPNARPSWERGADTDVSR
jgi:hypothetical protein